MQNFDRKEIEGILDELKLRVTGLYGERLVSAVLYGSYARAEADENSDIDVVVVLRGDVAPGAEIDRMIDIITDLSLKYNALVSVYPVSEAALKTVRSPLMLNIHKEGISL